MARPTAAAPETCIGVARAESQETRRSVLVAPDVLHRSLASAKMARAIVEIRFRAIHGDDARRKPMRRPLPEEVAMAMTTESHGNEA